jgi:filamentous hemagglutinin
MNKLRYRVVFNKARGMCMAVQETARSRGKGAGQGVADSSVPAAMRLPALRRMPYLMAIGLAATILGSNALAQIVADPKAPGQQQATVLNAANGVLQVNIQTPSAAGVSRNVYSQFDVPKTGAVLNNSRSNVQTQLGGWVQGNPWLSKGTARVILNEVNSSDPSRLQGYIEVAGDRAETIIANPAGIVVDGGGFINVSRATLTTGTPTIEDGFLKGYSVQRGQIVIDGAGLDASKTDYTALIARSLQVNAGLWAQRLNVITGANQVEEAVQAKVTQTGQAGNAAPLFAVDVASLGGMYANQIYLVGTEAGVGVRNAGEIGAVAGDLVVTANGRLENSGTLQASQSLQVSAHDVGNQGAMQAQDRLALTADNLINSGRINAGVDALIKVEGDVNNEGGRVEAARIDLAGTTLHNARGSIVQTGTSALSMEAARVINAAGTLGQQNASAGNGTGGTTAPDSATPPPDAGDASGSSDSGSGQPGGGVPVASSPAPTLADGQLTFKSIDNTAGSITANGAALLRTEGLDNRGGQTYLDTLSVVGSSFDNTGGTLTVVRSFTARTESYVNDQGKLLVGVAFDGGLGSFSNRQGLLQAGQLAVDVTRYLDNRSGTLRQLGGVTADIHVGDELALEQGTLEVAAGLRLRAGSISGSGSILNVTGDLSLESGTTSAAQATWLIGGSASLRTGALDNGGGKIATGGTLSVNSAALNNAGGTIAAATDAAITASGAIDNSHGIIQATHDLTLAATGALDNQAGNIETLASDSTMNLTGAAIDNRGGRIANAGAGNTTLKAGAVTNSGVIGGNGDVGITARTLTNEGTGSIASFDNMDMSVRESLLNAGTINAGGDFRMVQDNAQLSNHGTLVALGDIEIKAAAINNTSGQIATMTGGGGKMSLHAASLVNNNGLIDADGEALIDIQGNVNNERGQIRVGGDLALNASERIENRGGSIETAGRMQVHGGEIGNEGGTIVAAGTQASSIESDRGIENNGLIGANGQLAVEAEIFNNGAQGTLSAIGDLNMAVRGQLANDGGTISTAGTLNVDGTQATLVNSGTITSAGNAHLNVDQLNNDGGTIGTLDGASLGVTANGMSNRGGHVMAGANASVLVKGDIDNDGGVLQAAGSLDAGAGGSFRNREGVVEALDTHGTLAVRSADIDNTGGRIVNVGDGAASASASGHIENGGLIAGNGQVEVAAATMNNTGIVSSADKIELAVGRALNNSGTFSAATGLHTSQGDAVLRNSGTIVAGGLIEMALKTIDNADGVIATAQGSNADMLLSAQNVSNQSGAMMSDRLATFQVAGGFDNRSGLVQAKDQLQLSAGGVLDTSGGSIETLSADSTLQLHGGAVLNDAGRIVNTGSGDTRVSADTSLVSSGQIAGNGALNLQAESLVNQEQGSISGSALSLLAAASLENAGDINSRSTLTVDGGGAALNNHGNIVANGDITIHAAAIDNGSGTIATVGGSAAGIAFEATSLTNHGGRIVADRALTLGVSGALNNDRGIVQGGTSVEVTAGGNVSNDGGVIEAVDPEATLALQANAINNGSGRIVNVGQGTTTVVASGSLENSGLVAGNGKLDLRADALVNQATGTLASGGAMTATIDQRMDNAGTMSSGGTLDIAGRAGEVRNVGVVVANGALTVTSATFDNDGGQLATAKDSGADLQLDATSISNRGGAILSDRDVRVTSADAFENTTGTLQATGSLQLRASGVVGNDGGVIESLAPSAILDLDAGVLDNGTGRIVNVGTGATAVAVDGKLSSAGLIAGNGSVNLSASELDNQAAANIASGTTLEVAAARSIANAGMISSHETLRIDAAGAAVRNSGQVVSGASATIDAGSFDNSGGQLATAEDHGGDIVLHAGEIANVSGTMVADGAAHITSGAGLDNRQGMVHANDAIGIDVVGALGNQEGVIESAGAGANLDVRAQSIDNSAGRLVNVGSGTTQVAAAAGIVNSGILAGNGSVDLRGAVVDNLSAGTIAAGSTLDLHISQALDNAGTISATQTLSMDELAAQIANSGQIVAGDRVFLHGASISNDGGQIGTQSGEIVLSSESTLSNRSAVIAAAGNATLSALGAYDNSLGQVQTDGRLQVTAGGSLFNAGGVLEAVGAASTLTLNAASIDNTTGRIVNAGSGATTIASVADIVNSGTIAGNGALTLTSRILENANGGVIGSRETMELAVREQLANAGTISSSANLHFDQAAASFFNSGQIGAGGVIEITSDTLSNRGGQLYTANNSGAAINLRTGSLDNTGGFVSSDGELRAEVDGSASNGEGVLHGGAGTALNVGSQLANGSGTIETANGMLAIQAHSVESSGRIVNGGEGATTIDSRSDIVNSGTIAGNGALAISAQTLQNLGNGTIGTGSTLELAVREQLDNAGSISSGGTLRFDQTSAWLGNSGRIGAGSTIDIRAAEISNHGGQLFTASGSGAAINLLSGGLDNANGTIAADGNLAVETGGSVTNGGGTLHGGKGTTLSIGGALANGSGTIESASGVLTIEAQSVDSSGRIVNAGNGAASISAVGSIDNSGIIGGNGIFGLHAATLSNSGAGQLMSGGALELNVSQRLDNAGTISSGGSIHFDQSAATVSNNGTIGAGGSIDITAATVSNRGGQLYTVSGSGAAINLQTGSLDNTGGMVSADGQLRAEVDRSVANGGGVLHGGTSTLLHAGSALDNGSGTIEAAAGILEVQAQSVNSSGRIVNAGIGQTIVESATDIVNSGAIAGNGALDLHASVLQNDAGGEITSGGALQLDVRQLLANAGRVSSGGTLVFDQVGASFVNRGQIAAVGNIDFSAASFDNSGGQVSTVHGSGADITVVTSALKNRDGAILADGNASLLLSSDVDNFRGVLQAGGDLALTTSGVVSNGGGVIETLGAGSSLTVRGVAIDNGNGRIGNAGTGETRLLSQTSITNAGTIAAMGNLQLSGQTLTNQDGATIASGGNLVFEITRQLGNSGTINSGGALTFEQSSATFTNSGEAYFGGNAVVNVSLLNNDGGRLGTGSGSGADLKLTSQQLSNQDGRIATDRDLIVNAHAVSSLGELFAGRDLSLTMDGDYAQDDGLQHLRSNRDLSLSVTGNITNSSALEAAGILSLSGQQISNQSGASIAGQGVILKASGNLMNAGEINGVSMLDIVAANVSNNGGIVGGNVTAATGNLNNSGSSALIGAAGALGLGVAGTLNNTGGATLYSSGDMAIGGRNGGSAGAVNNISSTIEAAGSLAIDTSSLSNVRENVQIVKVKTVDENVHMTMPSWYQYGDNHDSFETSAANYRPHEVYFVSPSDILDDQVYVTPDGFTIHRAVIRTHANDSAFYVAASGLSTSYGQQARLTLSEGTRVIYYTEGAQVANPDQGAPASNVLVYSDSGVTHWSGTVSFSNQYGNCSSDCIRLVTEPGYVDPSSTILRDTMRALAPVKEQLEVSRDAHHTVVEDQLALGAGASAQILAGGDMYLNVSSTLENRFGEIKARGSLSIGGGAAISNVGTTLYRTHTFDGTWRTYGGQTVSYQQPSMSEVIGSGAGVILGSQGVSISGRSFSNVDVTAGTVGNIRDAVNVIGGQSGAGSAGSHATVNAGAGGTPGAQVTAGAGVNDSAEIRVAAGTGADGTADGHVSGSAIGAQTGLVGAVTASGRGSELRPELGAVASGKGGELRASGQMADSGYANDAATSGGASTSGVSNSLAANGAVGESGATNNGRLSGAITSARNNSYLGNILIGAGPSASEQASNVQGSGVGDVTKLAPSGLFIRNPDANGSYLFETRSQFANQQQWTSSDYLLRQLAFDPATTQKRLGDGFYEQRLVREQLAELTGHASYSGASDDSTYQQLLTNAVSVAREFGLRPGIALSAEQVSQLTSDIVWMESQNVMLPDGSVEAVLAPKVYLAQVGKHALQPGGALVTGNGVTIDTTDSIVNSGGVIDGGNGRTLLVAGEDIVNHGGSIKGGSVALVADRDVKNESLAVKETYDFGQNGGSYTSLSNLASITSTGSLDIMAGRDMSDLAGRITAGNATLTAGQNIDFGTIRTGSTYYSQISGYTEKDSSITHQLSQISTGGDLKIASTGNLNLSGTQVAVGIAGSGIGQLLAGGTINIAAVANEINTSVQNDPGSKQYDKQVHQNQTLVGTTVGASSGLTVSAGILEKGAINITASSLTAGDALKLSASDSVNIVSAQEQHLSDTALTRTSSSFMKSKTTQQADYVASSQAIGSTLSGKTVDISAGKDINVLGSAIAGDGDVSLAAVGSVTIGASTSTLTEQHHFQVKESGFLSGNGFGFSIGTRTTTTDQSRDATTQSGQSRSMVGSLGGNVAIVAGDAIKVSGSDLAAGMDMSLDGRSVTIDPGQDKSKGKLEQTSVHDGLTLAIGGSVVNAISTVQGMTSAASQSKDGRIQALAAATAGLAVKDAAADMTKNGLSVSVSLTVGHSESKYTQTTSDVRNSGSVLNAGNDITIRASGGGKESDINVVGSELNAKGNIVLKADNQVNLLAAQDQESQHSESKTLSAAAGVAVAIATSGPGKGVSAGLTASVSASRGNTDGEGTTQINTHVSAGQQLTISSGGDTNLKGAIASGSQVIADVGGDLNIESLQDKATFDSKNQGVSVSATVGIGANVGGSVNQSKMHNDYASVQEQSGIQAGDGGFQVTVGGNTDLKGGVISSSTAGAGASSLVTGTLTSSDLTNHATASASTAGIGGGGTIAGTAGDASAKGEGGIKLMNLGSGGAGASLPSVNVVSSNETGITRSGISAGSLVISDDAAQRGLTGKSAVQAVAGVNRDVITGWDTSGRVVNDFNPDAMQAELAVTGAFSAAAAPIAANIVGDIGKSKQDSAQREADAYAFLAAAAIKREDIVEAQVLNTKANEAQAVADSWSDSGANRVALHATAQGLIGGLASGSTGTMTSVSGVAGGNLGQELGQKLGAAEADRQGLQGEARTDLINTYQNTLATIGGAVVGLTVSSVSGTGEQNGLVGAIQAANTANGVDSFNRQLHPEEKQRIKQLAKGDPVKEARLTAVACAAVKCYAEFPVDSEVYQTLKQIADVGSSPALLAEREQLAQQQGLFGYTTTGFFSDKNKDAAKQINNSYQIGTRTLGAGQTVLGGLGVLGSLVTAPASCATVIGCAANAGVATLSLDAMYAGAKQIVSGSPEATFANKSLQTLGLSPQAAAWTEAAIGVGAAAKAASIANKVVDQSFALGKLNAATYHEFTPNGLAPTSDIMRTPQAQSLIKEIQGGSPGLSDAVAKNIAQEIIQSGSTLPRAEVASANSILIKVVPKGAGVSDFSPYWMTADQAKTIASSTAEQAAQILGLPAAQAGQMLKNGMDFFAISPKLGARPTVFVSKIAATTQGAYATAPTAQQVIVPNRALWTTATPISPTKF